MLFGDIGERLAARPGWEVQTNDQELQVIVTLAGGRRQTVYIRSVGRLDIEGVRSEVIEYYSAAIEIPSDQGLDPSLALNLLKTNAQMLLGAWAIGERGERQFIAVYDTALLETLDVEELAAAIVVIAAEADRLEELWAGEDLW